MSAASYHHLLIDYYFDLYYRYGHFLYLHQLSLSIPDDLAAFTNLMDASSIPTRTSLHDGAASSISFDSKEVSHWLHFTFVVHYHLSELKKRYLLILRVKFDSLTFWIFYSVLLIIAWLWLIVAARAGALTTILEVHTRLPLHDDHGLCPTCTTTRSLFSWVVSELLTAASAWLSWTWRSFVYIIRWSAARSIAALAMLPMPLLTRSDSIGAAGSWHVRMCLLWRIYLLRRFR